MGRKSGVAQYISLTIESVYISFHCRIQKGEEKTCVYTWASKQYHTPPPPLPPQRSTIALERSFGATYTSLMPAIEQFRHTYNHHFMFHRSKKNIVLRVSYSVVVFEDGYQNYCCVLVLSIIAATC